MNKFKETWIKKKAKSEEYEYLARCYLSIERLKIDLKYMKSNIHNLC